MNIYIITGTTDDGMVNDKLGAFPTREAAVEWLEIEKDPENIYQYDDYEIEVVELFGVKGWA